MPAHGVLFAWFNQARSNFALTSGVRAVPEPSVGRPATMDAWGAVQSSLNR